VETSVTFPGLAAIVPSARRFVRGVLAASPRADEMELVACELITNAIKHTASGDDGGTFTVRVRTGTGWARVEVSDASTGQWYPRDDRGAEDEYGRGLAIVAALAEKFGHDATPTGQTLWAEVHWPDTGQASA
jgi:serine/threonine-protein kinase RsbW